MALPQGEKKMRKALGHLIHEDLWEDEVQEHKQPIKERPITSVTRGEYKNEDGVLVRYYLTTELKADHCTLCAKGLCVQRVESSDMWDTDDVIHVSAYSAPKSLLS